MNTTLVYAGMPVLPCVSYLLLWYCGAPLVYRVIIPEIFVVGYVIAVACIAVRKAKEEESKEKEA